MSSIKISRNHDQDMEHAHAYANEIAEDLSSRFGVSYQWEGSTVKFKGAGAKGPPGSFP